AQLCHWQPDPAAQSSGSTPGLVAALGKLERVLRPGSRLLLTVDAHTLDDDALSRLRHLHVHHDLLIALLVDPLELSLPKAGALPLSDGRRTLWLDAGSASGRAGWQRAAGAAWREQLQALRRLGISARAV